MKKKCPDIESEFLEIVRKRIEDLVALNDFSLHEKVVASLEDEILNNCQEKNQDISRSFFDERIKQIYKFKKSKITKDSDQKWKKILNLRSHSKKIKKRGRKKSRFPKIDNGIKSFNCENNVNSNTSENIMMESPINNKFSSNARENLFEKSDELLKTRSVTKTLNILDNFNHPSAFSSKFQNKHPAEALVTPEKTKDIFSSSLRYKNDDATKNKSVIPFNTIAFASTYDKSKR